MNSKTIFSSIKAQTFLYKFYAIGNGDVAENSFSFLLKISVCKVYFIVEKSRVEMSSMSKYRFRQFITMHVLVPTA